MIKNEEVGPQLNILVIGRGVISSQYAWTFKENGNNIDFYIRPESIDKYKPMLNLQLEDRRKRQPKKIMYLGKLI